ncbi:MULTISPECIES: hypothetical protein [Sphingomonas]|uniref:hypothetical protein n=1 Tax=Sphingomonas TaxID=13687 RepID=UPI00254DE358|nr:MULTISPECIES: hypothetical protein [Sphingomonas]MDK8187799.1 hypothetical protein [Sphingomonas zeae]MDK8217653.1 hypothetical protein [Sphingomonas sp. UMB7805-LC452B]
MKGGTGGEEPWRSEADFLDMVLSMDIPSNSPRNQRKSAVFRAQFNGLPLRQISLILFDKIENDDLVPTFMPTFDLVLGGRT